MTILLTGVTGQVGSALIPICESLEPVIAADRNVLDLSNPAGLDHRLSELSPSLIINPAAYTAVDKAEDERDLAFRVNAEAPGVLARWAAKRDVPLIHFSTDYVFDGQGTTPFRESDAAQPLSVYGQSKLEGEQTIRSAGGACLVVRTSWVYDAVGNNFMRAIARLGAERDSLRIVSDQFGAPTSAAFIAVTVGRMLAGGLDEFGTRCRHADGLVHVAAGGVTTWHGFAAAILDGLRARGHRVVTSRIDPITTAEYPTRAQRPKNSRLDLTRLKAVFDVTPPRWDSLLPEELNRFAGSSG